jgi:hypothetical protein
MTHVGIVRTANVGAKEHSQKDPAVQRWDFLRLRERDPAVERQGFLSLREYMWCLP